MQLEIDAIKKAAAWPGADRRTPGERARLSHSWVPPATVAPAR